MEDHVHSLLIDTFKNDTNAIRSAEEAITALYPDPQFPVALLNIASHTDVDVPSRKSALTTLKNYVLATWSPQFDETFQGNVYLNDEAKSRVRDQIFTISITPADSGMVDLQGLAASVVGKIASADFPDEWPSLLSSLLNIVNASNDGPTLRGALKSLAELIDSGLAEDQFFATARDLVSAFQRVSTNNEIDLNTRALSLNVLQISFDTLEMVMKAHRKDVQAFLDECLKTWMTFFITAIQEPLPAPQGLSETDPRRGLITFKIQVVTTVEKLRKLYPSGLAPHATDLFRVIWQDLSRIAPEYVSLYIDSDALGRQVGESDNLPYSLDLLAVEEIDFLQTILRAPSVRSELSQQVKQPNASDTGYGWIQQLLGMLVQYSRVSQDDQEMWDADVDIFLSEMDSITANYTARAACAELVSRTLYDWLKQSLIDAMLFFNKHRGAVGEKPVSSKDQEAFLYLLKQAINELDTDMNTLEPSLVSQVMEQVSGCLQHSSPYVRAGAHFVLGTLFKVSGESFHDAGASSFANAVQTISSDDSDIVKVTCFSMLPQYIDSLPRKLLRPMQNAIFDAVADFIASHDLADELDESDEVKGALITALRDSIMLDTINVTESSAIDTLLTLASNGATSFLLASQVEETFEAIASSISEYGTDSYAKLCSKTIPALSGAFDIGDMTSESALTNLAAQLISTLAQFGSDPLPEGFVAAVMPKLQRVLMQATDDVLIQPATTAVTFALKKGTSQFMQWKDQSSKSSLEVVLTIINRLLNAPEIDEQAAQEVGGLASVVVEKYGAEQLGPYLPDLLQALATRLHPAQQIQFIQSLLMVFVNLTLSAPKDVVDFLDQLTIANQNGLHVVLAKWLESSILFAGFDEVRQNIVALSKLYALQDPRVKSLAVKGDLIVENTGRIKTRSQAKLNPDRYTMIPADLKILKILVEELRVSAESKFSNTAAQASLVADAESEGANSDDDGEWEDEPAGIDLGSAAVREELMAFAAGSPTGSRARDEETADYLVKWFREVGGTEGFQAAFLQLNAEEQQRLNMMAG